VLPARLMRRARRIQSTSYCERLEVRTLLTALVVNDTAAVDVITMDVSAGGGVITVVNGTQTEYALGQWDSVFVTSATGGDTINVRATVVPTTVKYVGSSQVSVNVGNAHGVQDINATLNMNGAAGGPARGGSAAIRIDDTADAAGRNVQLVRQGRQEQITGLAPARIEIGLVIEPVSPLGSSESSDSVSLITGSGGDTVTVRALRDNLDTSISNPSGNDTVNVGGGSLADISSTVEVAGPSPFLMQPGQTVLNVDGSGDAVPTQFTITALYPPGPGALMELDYQVGAGTPQRVSYFVAGIASATVNGGPAGNTFVVQDVAGGQTPGAPTLTLNTGAGNDTVTVNHTGGGRLVVNGQGGSDTFKTGPIGPFAGVNSADFNGGDGVDSLTLQGPLASPFDIPSSPVYLAAGVAQHLGVTIGFAVDALTIQNGQFVVNEDLGPLALVVASDAAGQPFESPTDVTINVTQRLKSLDIADGPVTLAAHEDQTLNTGSLNIAKGTLDLTDNRLEVHYGAGADPFVAIRNWVFKGTIKSLAADVDHSLGYADSADNIVAGLSGQTVLVQYTLRADANIDRTVDFADLVRLAQHFNNVSGDEDWVDGDFTYDGKVDFNDLVVLGQHYNTAMPGGALVTASRNVAVVTASVPALASGRPVVVQSSRPVFRVVPAKPKARRHL